MMVMSVTRRVGRRIRAGLVAVALVTGSTALADQTPSQLPTFRGGVELVTVRAIVRDSKGRPVTTLEKTEFDLLELLVRNKDIVLDHSTIYDRIWHYDFGPDSKNLAVYIGYLRRKTELDGEPRIVHTVRGVGYTARLDGS